MRLVWLRNRCGFRGTVSKVSRKYEEVTEIHLAVAVDVAVGIAGDRVPEVLRDDEEVAEIDLTILVQVSEQRILSKRCLAATQQVLRVYDAVSIAVARNTAESYDDPAKVTLVRLDPQDIQVAVVISVDTMNLKRQCIAFCCQLEFEFFIRVRITKVESPVKISENERALEFRYGVTAI